MIALSTYNFKSDRARDKRNDRVVALKKVRMENEKDGMCSVEMYNLLLHKSATDSHYMLVLCSIL